MVNLKFDLTKTIFQKRLILNSFNTQHIISHVSNFDNYCFFDNPLSFNSPFKLRRDVVSKA